MRVALLLVVVSGCARREAPAQPAQASRADALDSGSSALVDARPSEGGAIATCRAIAVVGGARIVGDDVIAGAPITVGSKLPAGSNVELDAGAQVTLRSPANGREWSLHGPARASVCRASAGAVGGTDANETELRAGGFESSPGSGEAPGEEAWVVTPFGVVRYAVAAMRVTVTGRGADLQVSRGAAYAFVAPGPWSRVGEGGALRLEASGTPWQAACAEATARVGALRGELTAHAASPGVTARDGGTFASLSAESVTEGERRRAACAVATMIASAR